MTLAEFGHLRFFFFFFYYHHIIVILFFMKYNFGSVSVLCYRFTIFRFLFYSFYLLMTNDFFSNIRIGIINLVSDIYSSFDHNTRSN